MKPLTFDSNTSVSGMLQYICEDVCSAQSALNMPPEEIPLEYREYKECSFLSETDVYAKHTMDHLINIHNSIRTLESKMLHLRTPILNIFLQLDVQKDADVRNDIRKLFKELYGVDM